MATDNNLFNNKKNGGITTMQTPKEFKKNLEKRKVTLIMILMALFSLNKRAKNYRENRDYERDKKKFNRYYFDKYHNEELYEAKMRAFYGMKEFLLSFFSPTCIHRVFHGYKTIKYTEYDSEFRKLYENGDLYNVSTFVDRDNDDLLVTYGYYDDKTQPRYGYFLFYEIEEYSFHSPIKNDCLNNYDLPIYDISELNTYGHDINDLLSIPFTKKIVNGLKDGTLTFVPDIDNNVSK